MTRKFLFCFPLRVGNIIFGYILILITLAVIAFNLYELGLNISNDYKDNERFKDFQNLDTIFGASRDALVAATILAYYLSYVIIGFLLFIFAVIFTCGAYKANHCLVTTFFVYSFFHLFFTVVLVVWEALSAGWIQLGLILLSDLLLIICLFSVKYLMEAIRTGNIYSPPGEVYYKY
ncbi:uncharacterized protein LOC115442898 [Manduca sexta]|uniref:uncharacterized protein LOC115442898 n=1 Tax=Manduca sexta TaxID=7130 RepID=UPI00188F85AF|nr:uncharacterized protein LOC115442898 [Manduca sexta]XP_030023971.2 uncharacterized protein LOC115442898 [Manduca sexta]XP_030023978.2 uncharacterized protein LOC115442898 [Manduca sexta]XP_037293528.1 uncharacterized protein LOC115442898 [Manduca sexta]